MSSIQPPRALLLLTAILATLAGPVFAQAESGAGEDEAPDSAALEDDAAFEGASDPAGDPPPALVDDPAETEVETPAEAEREEGSAPRDPAADDDEERGDEEGRDRIEREDDREGQRVRPRDDDEAYEDEDEDEDDWRRRRDDDDRDRDSEDERAPTSGGGLDTDRILWGGIGAGLALRFFPIIILDYLVAPFAAEWFVEQFADQPISYETNTKLLAALAMFLFDLVVGGGVVAAAVAVSFGLGLFAAGLASPCGTLTFLGLSVIPIVAAGFVGAYVMEWRDGNVPARARKSKRKGKDRRRRRRRASLPLPFLPGPAAAMVF